MEGGGGVGKVTSMKNLAKSESIDTYLSGAVVDRRIYLATVFTIYCTSTHLFLSSLFSLFFSSTHHSNPRILPHLTYHRSFVNYNSQSSILNTHTHTYYTSYKHRTRWTRPRQQSVTSCRKAFSHLSAYCCQSSDNSDMLNEYLDVLFVFLLSIVTVVISHISLYQLTRRNGY